VKEKLIPIFESYPYSVLYSGTGIILGFISILGLILILLSVARLYQRRMISAGLHGFSGLVLVLSSLLVFSVSLNLHTYQRLTYEQAIAELTFQKISPQYFKVILKLSEDNTKVYDLYGNEWQLDARVLKWHGIANLFGLDANYRLERISGRYREIQQERSKPRTVFSLSDSAGLDLWSLVKQYGKWFPWIDAYYGSAAFMPMADQANYRVSITQSGLIARPVNEQGNRVLQSWQ
jgi:hypothetical protein